MTHSETGPAPSPGRARVLLSPDGTKVAVAIPAFRREPLDLRVWFVVEPDPEGSHVLETRTATGDEVRSWIPVTGVNVLHEHVAHWRAVAAARPVECSDRVRPGVCCFPEGVGTAVGDVEDLINATEERTWRE